MSLVNIDNKEAEKKLSIVRRYLNEIVHVVMAFCVYFLFQGQRSLEQDMRKYLYTDRSQALSIIEIQAITTKENTEILKDVKELLRMYATPSTIKKK